MISGMSRIQVGNRILQVHNNRVIRAGNVLYLYEYQVPENKKSIDRSK